MEHGGKSSIGMIDAYVFAMQKMGATVFIASDVMTSSHQNQTTLNQSYYYHNTLINPTTITQNFNQISQPLSSPYKLGTRILSLTHYTHEN